MIDEKKLIEAINCKMGEIKSDKEKCEVISGFADIVLEIYDGILYFVKDQPKVGEWIPCGERVPEKPKFEKGYIIQSEIIEEPYSAYWNGEKWTDADNRELSDIVAWMPLPEPYRPGGVNHEE